MSFVLKEKLKATKINIKEWSKTEYGGMEDRLECLIEEIKCLDEKGEVEGLNDVEILNRKGKFGELWRLLKAKDSLVVQRSRSKWLKEGDTNSNFFHNCVKSRASRNSLKALRVDDMWVTSPFEVRKAVVEFFTNHVEADTWERPRLEGVHFDRLTEAENEALIAPFSMLEIEAVVRESDGNKIPGPDGFNFAFVKEFWYLIKEEVRIMFDQFHGNEVIPKGMLAYFVALILKVSSPMTMKDYRPISLLGCLYKILAKVLARRMAQVMNSIISSSQSAFLKGRNLVDGVLVVNELVDYAKKRRRNA